MGGLAFREVFRCALEHDLTAGIAAFRAQVDDPVGCFTTSRLCSITRSEFPAVISRSNAARSFRMSSKWSPVVGSSNT